MEVRFRQTAGMRGIAVEVASGGVSAIEGTGRCEISLAHVGESGDIGQARSVWNLDPAQFDLIITAQQSHLDALLAQLPEVHDRAFPLVRVAALAQQFGGLAEADDLREFVKAIRQADQETPKPERSKYAIFNPLDIPDPHVLGTNLHGMAAEMITESIETLINGGPAITDPG